MSLRGEEIQVKNSFIEIDYSDDTVIHRILSPSFTIDTLRWFYGFSGMVGNSRKSFLMIIYESIDKKEELLASLGNASLRKNKNSSGNTGIDEKI